MGTYSNKLVYVQLFGIRYLFEEPVPKDNVTSSYCETNGNEDILQVF